MAQLHRVGGSNAKRALVKTVTVDEGYELLERLGRLYQRAGVTYARDSRSILVLRGGLAAEKYYLIGE